MTDFKKLAEEIKLKLMQEKLKHDIAEMKVHTNRDVSNFASIRSDIMWIKVHPVSYYREITSYNKHLYPFVKFAKRVIRKLCKFIIEPAINDINTNSSRCMAALEKLTKEVEKIYLARESTSETINDINTRVLNRIEKQVNDDRASMVKQVYEMSALIKDLEQQLDSMKEKLDRVKYQCERAELKADIAKLAVEKSGVVEK